MGSQLAFCPACYAEVPVDTAVCPHCGASLEEWQRRSYAEKLIPALHHPLADVRMRVIIALGLQHETQAEQALSKARCDTPSMWSRALRL